MEKFREITGPDYVFTHEDVIIEYSHDFTENLVFPPDAVIIPGNSAEISEILRYCNSQGIAVTVSGARTGLSGGMLPVQGGLILSTERLNQILEIDRRNFQVTTQPGVITQVLQDAVEKHGLFYPVDPASRGSCFIGGNIAESAGGMRAAKYGITRDFVLNLEVVLANGEIIFTGSRTWKNSTGFDLTRLFVGSEGMLGVITAATLKLIHLPRHRILMLIPFVSGAEACEAVSEIYLSGLIPSAIEFMESEAIHFAQEFLGEKRFDLEGIEAHLLLEFDGNEKDMLLRESEMVFSLLEKFKCGEALLAETPDEQERLWKVRRSIGEATRSVAIVKEEDTCVPRAELAKLWKFAKSKTSAAGIHAMCFGHAGDGNLHIHMLKDKSDPSAWEAKANPVIREIFQYAVSLGGTISGEHGIGWAQKDFLDIAVGSQGIELMKGIKDLFDPNGILNPGKMFPKKDK